jgi:Cu+-exporting ATPase
MLHFILCIIFVLCLSHALIALSVSQADKIHNTRLRVYSQYVFIKNLQKKGAKVCMIGDGLNDAMALKQSNIGVALTEKNNNFTPSADIILSADKLAHFFELLEMIKHSQRVIIYCFIFSFLFNIIGLYFSVQGILSPLIAAILMTCSSLSIIGMSYFLLIRFKK